MKKGFIILLLLVIFVPLVSCTKTNEKGTASDSTIYQANDDTTSEQATTNAKDSSEKSNQTEDMANYSISSNFTWNDYVKNEKKAEAQTVTLQQYIGSYFIYTDEYKIKTGEKNDFKYIVYENGQAIISEYTGTNTDIVFPDEIDGYPVVGIGKIDISNSNVYKYALSHNKDINIKTGKNTLFISGDAFDHCSYKVKTVTLNDGIKVIFDGAFSSTNSLSEINFPQSIKEIGQSAFYNCKNLNKVDLSKTSIRKVEAGCFAECYSLSEVILPDSVCRIEKEAFYRSTDLSSINLPTKLKIVDKTAFSGTSVNMSLFTDNKIEIGEDLIYSNDEDILLK